jgi:hypothetical protein
MRSIPTARSTSGGDAVTLPLVGLADILRAAGLTVVEYPGWKDRGQDDGPYVPRGVMWHHDASAPGDSPGVPAMMANLANNGAQCWVDRLGLWYPIAAGRMWHAGRGGPWGVAPRDDGNTYLVGVETDHTTGEDWPAAQHESLRLGTAAIMRAYGWNPANALMGHKEYRPTNPDPDGLDMSAERRAVAELMKSGLRSDFDQGEDDMVKLIRAKGQTEVYLLFILPGGSVRRHIKTIQELEVYQTIGMPFLIDLPAQVVNRVPLYDEQRSSAGKQVWDYLLPTGVGNEYAPAHGMLAKVNALRPTT